MTSREDFAAFARGDYPPQPPNDGGGNGTSSGWMESWAKRGQGRVSPRPPQARKYGEQAPLLSPASSMPASVLSAPSWPTPQAPMPVPPNPRGGGHARVRSDHPFHPLSNGGRVSKPPRASQPPAAPSVTSGSPRARRGKGHRRGASHRRAKSDIPLAMFGTGGSGSFGGGQVITKADLLKNLPNPRWGGATRVIKPQRPRTGSDGFQLDDGGSTYSGPSGYGALEAAPATGNRAGLQSIVSGRVMEYRASIPRSTSDLALQSIGSVEIGPDAKRRGHVRRMSDASVRSVTTDLAKSALVKTVTESGHIQLQLPKDSFRLLMDNALEAGVVYKRKLVDNEEDYFVEFYTESDDPLEDEEDKRLPPDLYVMAVDATLYRRMLDEVIQSRSMPCGTFFCGHHEDVRQPDITFASLVVGAVMLVTLVLIKLDPS